MLLALSAGGILVANNLNNINTSLFSKATGCPAGCGTGTDCNKCYGDWTDCGSNTQKWVDGWNACNDAATQQPLSDETNSSTQDTAPNSVEDGGSCNPNDKIYECKSGNCSTVCNKCFGITKKESEVCQIAGPTGSCTQGARNPVCGVAGGCNKSVEQKVCSNGVWKCVNSEDCGAQPNISGGGTDNTTASIIPDGAPIKFTVCEVDKTNCTDIDGCTCPNNCTNTGTIFLGGNCGGNRFGCPRNEIRCTSGPYTGSCKVNCEEGVTSTAVFKTLLNSCTEVCKNVAAGCTCNVDGCILPKDKFVSNGGSCGTKQPPTGSTQIPTSLSNCYAPCSDTLGCLCPNNCPKTFADRSGDTCGGICTPSQTRLSEKCGNPCRSDQKSLEKCNILGTLWEPVTPAQCTDASTSCTDTKQPTLSKCSEAICSDSDDCICPINQCNRTIAKNGYDCGGDKSAEAVVAKPQFDPTIQKDTVKPLLGQCTTDKCTDADGCVCRDNCVKSFVGSGDFDKTCGGVKPVQTITSPQTDPQKCIYEGRTYTKTQLFCSFPGSNKILKCEGNNVASLAQTCTTGACQNDGKGKVACPPSISQGTLTPKEQCIKKLGDNGAYMSAVIGCPTGWNDVKCTCKASKEPKKVKTIQLKEESNADLQQAKETATLDTSTVRYQTPNTSQQCDVLDRILCLGRSCSIVDGNRVCGTLTTIPSDSNDCTTKSVGNRCAPNTPENSKYSVPGTCLGDLICVDPFTRTLGEECVIGEYECADGLTCNEEKCISSICEQGTCNVNNSSYQVGDIYFNEDNQPYLCQCGTGDAPEWKGLISTVGLTCSLTNLCGSEMKCSEEKNKCVFDCNLTQCTFPESSVGNYITGNDHIIYECKCDELKGAYYDSLLSSKVVPRNLSDEDLEKFQETFPESWEQYMYFSDGITFLNGYENNNRLNPRHMQTALFALDLFPYSLISELTNSGNNLEIIFSDYYIESIGAFGAANIQENQFIFANADTEGAGHISGLNPTPSNAYLPAHEIWHTLQDEEVENALCPSTPTCSVQQLAIDAFEKDGLFQVNPDGTVTNSDSIPLVGESYEGNITIDEIIAHFGANWMFNGDEMRELCGTPENPGELFNTCTIYHELTGATYSINDGVPYIIPDSESGN